MSNKFQIGDMVWVKNDDTGWISGNYMGETIMQGRNMYVIERVYNKVFKDCVPRVKGGIKPIEESKPDDEIVYHYYNREKNLYTIKDKDGNILYSGDIPEKNIFMDTYKINNISGKNMINTSKMETIDTKYLKKINQRNKRL